MLEDYQSGPTKPRTQDGVSTNPLWIHRFAFDLGGPSPTPEAQDVLRRATKLKLLARAR